MDPRDHLTLKHVFCAQESSNGAPPKKKSKRKAISATPAPTPSGLPTNFFDSGVAKKFYPRGEEPYYKESDSDGEEGGPAEPEATPTTKEVAATAPPSGLPAGIIKSEPKLLSICMQTCMYILVTVSTLREAVLR